MPLVDFAIITGLDEEIKYLKDAIKGLEENDEFGNSEVWYRGRVTAANGRSYSVVASFQNDMGVQQAHALTAQVIHRWDPAYIVLVGIAGSFHKSVRLGHVIVSNQIFYYDPGKATEVGLEYRPEGYPCSTTLVHQAKALSQDEKNLEKWRNVGHRSAAAKAEAAKLRPKSSERGSKATKKRKVKRASSLKELESHVPEVHFGTIASGSLVIASERMQKRLLELHGKIIGTEMEGAGMLHHTFTLERPTPCIVIKGISDHADPNKAAADEEKYWRSLAGENAGRYLLAMLQRGRIEPLHTDRFALDVSRATRDEIGRAIPDVASPGVAYLGFPTLIRPAGPITWLSIAMKASDEAGGRVAIRKLVVKYVGLEGEPAEISLRAEGKVIDLSDGEAIRLPRLSAQPVQLYLMAATKATAIEFRVRSPADEQVINWVLSG